MVLCVLRIVHYLLSFVMNTPAPDWAGGSATNRKNPVPAMHWSSVSEGTPLPEMFMLRVRTPVHVHFYYRKPDQKSD